MRRSFAGTVAHLPTARYDAYLNGTKGRREALERV